MRPHSLQTLSEEIRSQPEALSRFAKAKLPSAEGPAIFVGAGDSFAAALAAFYLSKGRCLALDPYTLAASPETATGREVYFISVSGRTVSNVRASAKVKKFARATASITADEDSRLAKSTGRVVKLPMEVAPRTPGLLSFTLSVVAALKISLGDASCDFVRAFKEAEGASKSVRFGKGTTYFLGNAAAHAAALYSAAKVYEFLGEKAHAELLEEFSHLELFSLTGSDSVNIFSYFDPDGIAKNLKRELGAEYHLSIIPDGGHSDFESLFHSIFAVQLAVIRQAKVLGLEEPRFLGAAERLEASDSMIY